MEDVITNDTQDLTSINYRVIHNAGASRVAAHDVYTGVVEVKQTYNMNALVKRMTERGCAAKKSTIKLVLSDFAELVSDLVAEGNAVNIPGLVRFAPAIRGTFASEEDVWNGNEHRIVVNATSGHRMRAAAANSSVTRTTSVVLPKLIQLADMASGHLNVISSQGTFMVTGERLTWNANAEDEGWFLNLAGDEVKCTAVEGTQDPACAVLRTTMVFETSGVPLELFFRTRINDVLRQVKYGTAVVTAAAD